MFELSEDCPNNPTFKACIKPKLTYLDANKDRNFIGTYDFTVRYSKAKIANYATLATDLAASSTSEEDKIYITAPAFTLEVKDPCDSASPLASSFPGTTPILTAVAGGARVTWKLNQFN